MEKPFRWNVIILIVITIVLSACAQVRVEVQEGASGDTKKFKKDFYVFGLVGEHHINVTQHCPNGVVMIAEEYTMKDVLWQIFTLGVYAPRHAYLYCRKNRRGIK